jgi:hypothetical protein
MIPPSVMAIAAMTVMLWIIWSDTVRAKRPSPVLYTLRIALFLVVSGILILNVVRYPQYFHGLALAVAVLAILVGLGGAFYFARKLVQRS